MSTLAAFLVALLATLALTPAVRRLALRLGAVDHAGSSRKVHRRPTPRLGGLAIAGGSFLAVGLTLLADGRAREAWQAEVAVAGALALGGLAVAALGLRDDLAGVPPRAKLLVEFAAAGLLFSAGLRIDEVSLPVLGAVELGWLSLPVTLLWVAGVTNAVNLIDGLDGLAGGVAALAALAMGSMALAGGQPVALLLAAALAGASLGFLRHNAFPASIFMGDTGSLFLGFALAALSLELHQGPTPAAGLLAPGLALGLPLADTALAVARRALRGAPLFRADRGHLHHRLLARGLGHRGAVQVLWAASMALAAAGVLVALVGDGGDLAVVAALAAAGAAALWRLGLLDPGALRSALADRRRNLVRRAHLKALGADLRRAGGLAEVWGVLRRGALLLGAAGASLRLPAREAGGLEAAFDAGADADAMTRARAALTPEAGGGAVELRWPARTLLDRDTEIALELLVAEVARAVARLRRRRPRAISRPGLAAVPAGGRATRS